MAVSADDRVKGLYWAEFEDRTWPATKNLAPGVNVYGERVVKVGKDEYRVWDPFRSKLAAALLKGLRGMPIMEGSRVLYLGASTGTTVSHVSDLIGRKGLVFAVEISHRVARELMMRVVAHRKNVIPIVEDARRPERYRVVFKPIHVVYCDIAQPDQTEIAILNAKRLLNPNGSLLLVVKARSIDVAREPLEVIKDEEKKLRRAGFKVKQRIVLDPFDKDHGMIHATL